MEKLVVYYTLEGSAPFWSEITEKFKTNLSASGVPYFKEELEAESKFARFCSERGIKTVKKTILEYSGNSEATHPFYFLCVRDTREYNYEFVRLNCDGGGKIICWNEARQFRKIMITRKSAGFLTQNDIVSKNFPLSPRVYLITRKLKEIIQGSNLSGCSFLPCLEEGKSYSEDDLDYTACNQKLDQDAAYFQLIIKSKTIGPPKVGKLLSSVRCPRCKIVTLMNADREWCFFPQDLCTVDFQFFSEFVSESQGCLKFTGEIPIISSKALKLFLEYRIKGLKVYSDNPPIKYAVVNVV